MNNYKIYYNEYTELKTGISYFLFYAGGYLFKFFGFLPAEEYLIFLFPLSSATYFLPPVQFPLPVTISG